MLSERAVKRHVKTFQDRPVTHVIESETVDYDNRSFSFSVFGHEDPNVVTLILGGNEFTRSRACLTESMERVLQAIKEVPPA